MSKKLLLVGAILVVGIAAVASFAVTQTSASVTLGIIGGGASSFMNVTTEGTQVHTTTASWSPIEDTAGGIVDKGDLYYLEPYTSTGTVDAIAFVYLTNVGDLAGCYSYLNMGVNLWKSTDGTTYTEVISPSVTANPADQWLTLTNGYISLPLDESGVYTYAITLDEVSWYCTDGTCNGGGGSLSPAFFVDIIQK